jgi:hypothetical protein
VRVCVHICIHTYIHAYIHTYIHTYIRITHTHTDQEMRGKRDEDGSWSGLGMYVCVYVCIYAYIHTYASHTNTHRPRNARETR